MAEAKINIKELRKRIEKARTRQELLELEEEVKNLMDREHDDEIEDIAMEISYKKQYFKSGCDPFKVILRKKGGCC